MRRLQKFTKNKQVVRDLQFETIERYNKTGLGKLSYFGLPSASLEDVKQWDSVLSYIAAVERGEPGKEWELQHEIEFRAFQLSISDKLDLFRGDIDKIIVTGKDLSGKKPRYPFDIVSLDYSGGLFYLDAEQSALRLNAIERLFARQSSGRRDFILFVSCNLDQLNQREIRKTLRNIQTQLTRYGIQAERVVTAYVQHPRDEARLKLYVPYMINQIAAKYHFNCITEPTIIYSGNRRMPMMSFRFGLEFDAETISIREPRERVSQIINAPFISVEYGQQRRISLNLPRLPAPERT